jgi:nucleotide-binding universal stress UspA family protein
MEVVFVSSSQFLLAVAIAWLVIGAALSLVLGRRGHSGFSWFVLGTLLGPLAIGLAISSWRSDEHPEPSVVAGPSAGIDGVDVLAGFDGSPESRAALDTVIELLDDRLGRLTIATVVHFDGGADKERSALGALDRENERLAWLAPGLEVLKGHPATALTTRVTEDGYQLLAVGMRGHGRAYLFGSAAGELVRTSKIPVLLVGDGKTST